MDKYFICPGLLFVVLQETNLTAPLNKVKMPTISIEPKACNFLAT